MIFGEVLEIFHDFPALLTGRSEAPVGDNETPWILGRCVVHPAISEISIHSCPEAAKNSDFEHFGAQGRVAIYSFDRKKHQNHREMTSKFPKSHRNLTSNQH